MRDWERLRAVGKGAEKLFDEGKAYTDLIYVGHWIIHSEHCKSLGVQPSGLGEYYWCSQCNCGIDSKAFHMIEYNFCPNCGADMRGESK